MKKTNSRITLTLFIALGIILTIIGMSIYQNEKTKYEERNDFTRASIIMTLSYNKELSLFYSTLRINQSLTDKEKDSKEELIYDFAKSDMIPILNYVKKETKNENLEEVFEQLGLLISDYNFITIGERENIFVKQANGKYYTEDGDLYTYYTKKNVITRKGFQNLYNDYLNYLKINNVVDNLVEKIYNNVEKKLTKNEIKNSIINNDISFYNNNEDIIIKSISEDLINFCKFVSNNYFYENDNIVNKLKKEIDSEEIEITFKMKKNKRVYSKISKYENYNYILDTENLFKQIEKLNYPKIYF